MIRRLPCQHTRGKGALYNIFIKKSAERDLDLINDPFLSKIISGIESLGKNPRNVNVRKLVKRDNEYRLRIGDYRVLFIIDEREDQLLKQELP